MTQFPPIQPFGDRFKPFNPEHSAYLNEGFEWISRYAEQYDQIQRVLAQSRVSRLSEAPAPRFRMKIGAAPTLITPNIWKYAVTPQAPVGPDFLSFQLIEGPAGIAINGAEIGNTATQGGASGLPLGVVPDGTVTLFPIAAGKVLTMDLLGVNTEGISVYFFELANESDFTCNS